MFAHCLHACLLNMHVLQQEISKLNPSSLGTPISSLQTKMIFLEKLKAGMVTITPCKRHCKIPMTMHSFIPASKVRQSKIVTALLNPLRVWRVLLEANPPQNEHQFDSLAWRNNNMSRAKS